jgi:hypothetical protein
MAVQREDAYDRSAELEREALDAALRPATRRCLATVDGQRLAALLGGRHDAA